MTKGTVDIIGVPLDLGANIRGSNMGPATIRVADLHRQIEVLGFVTQDLGDILVPYREQITKKDQAQNYLGVIEKIVAELALITRKSIESKHIPLTIGGDHTVAIGSISGVSGALHSQGKKLGLIWVDAHADLNTPETSPTGNIHGMPLAVVLGKGHSSLTSIQGSFPKVRPENVSLIGIRAIDNDEREFCKSSGIRYFTMREIDERGLSKVMEEAIQVASKDTDGIHLSFDLDAIEPLYAPGVSTPVTGGLSHREAHLCLEMIADSKKLISMDFVEVNPMTDLEHKTAKLTVDLILSALGKSII
jgi:arginase